MTLPSGTRDEEILTRLLALNLGRAAKEGAMAAGAPVEQDGEDAE